MAEQNVKHWAILGTKKYEVFKDDKGTVRFPRNRIIDDLVEAAGKGEKLDLNMICVRYAQGKYTLDEVKGLYLNIGYSVSGISELSYFENEEMGCCCWEKPPSCGRKAK